MEHPLSHFMQSADDDLDGVVAPQPTSVSQLLTVLPQQSHSINGAVLDLCWKSRLPPLRVSLVIDAAPGCGGLAWPAGQILASYLLHRGSDYIRNKSIIELGSGTGLVGLVAGALEPTAGIWITDQAPLLDIMNRNVALNSLEANVKVAELNWGEPIPSNIPSPNIILAADCVYFEPAFPLLVQTLSDLSNATTDILFCYKKRRKADKRFFGMLKKKFTWKEVADDPNREIYNREAITLIELFKIE